MKINFSSTLCCFCILLFASCAKDEGEGGKSTIKGKLFERKYDNSYQNLLSESASPDEKVYIIYGDDHETYDDDYSTSYNGEYEFKYLQKGTYTIFAYTTDTNGVAATGYVDENKPKIPVFAKVDVNENGSTVTAPDLTIMKHNKDGSSTIRGKLFEKKYDPSITLLLSQYYVSDENVYIISGTNTETYFDDYKTSWNGEYYFDKLPPGNYRIFVYTPDTTGVAANGIVDFTLQPVPVFSDVNIPGNGVEVNVPDITIYRFKD